MAGALAAALLSGCGESSQPKQKSAPSPEAQAEQMRKETDEKAWADALRDGTIAGFKAYLASHPTGAHAGEARERLAALEQKARKEAEEKASRQAEEKARKETDDKAWADASSADTVAALKAYLDTHPTGAYAPEARKRLAALEERARKESAEQARKLAEEQARKEADEKAWAEALKARTIAGFKTYLQAHGSGAHAAEARKRLAALEAKSGRQEDALRLRKAAALRIPTIDLRTTCQPATGVAAPLKKKRRDTTPDEGCIRSELSALDDIIKQWAQFTSADRSRCITPSVYSPSYVEWLTCLEMQRDVRKLRQGNPSPIPTTKQKR